MSAPLKDSLVHARDNERLERAQSIPYTTTDHGDCSAYLYRPHEMQKGKVYPVIIFFHGGLFDTRIPGQFAPHCLHFANRGMLSFSLEYRVKSTNKTSCLEALEDARSFIQYLSANQAFFQADLENIVVAGNAGGALLASHLCSRHKHSNPELHDLPRPVAQVLYSPLLNTTEKGTGSDLFPDKTVAKKNSPSELIEKNYPPTIAFHGKDDNVIPYSHSEKYFKVLKRKKNHAELVGFEAGRHVDFNHNVNPQYYEMTLRGADNFLTDLNIINPDPDAFLD